MVLSRVLAVSASSGVFKGSILVADMNAVASVCSNTWPSEVRGPDTLLDAEVWRNTFNKDHQDKRTCRKATAGVQGLRCGRSVPALIGSDYLEMLKYSAGHFLLTTEKTAPLSHKYLYKSLSGFSSSLM